ncbi:hypothetical protein IE00_10075 [Paracoccus sp. SM22M-07]|nr:hypothetical protein IE00_10075 [Paracoccus sp. SM22M-07]
MRDSIRAASCWLSLMSWAGSLGRGPSGAGPVVASVALAAGLVAGFRGVLRAGLDVVFAEASAGAFSCCTAASLCLTSVAGGVARDLPLDDLLRPAAVTSLSVFLGWLAM